jgi:hypothetical protein
LPPQPWRRSASKALWRQMIAAGLGFHWGAPCVRLRQLIPFSKSAFYLSGSEYSNNRHGLKRVAVRVPLMPRSLQASVRSDQDLVPADLRLCGNNFRILFPQALIIHVANGRNAPSIQSKRSSSRWPESGHSSAAASRRLCANSGHPHPQRLWAEGNRSIDRSLLTTLGD